MNLRRLLTRLKDWWYPKPTNTRQHWNEWAHRLPRSAFVIWLAGHVANNLIASKSHSCSVADLIDGVDNGSTGMLQSSAEHFLEMYYYNYPSSDPHMYQMISIFRRLVKRKLRKHL